MPLFQTPAGEGIYIEPARRRPKALRSPSDFEKLHRACLWYRLHAKPNDMTIRAIAALFEKSVSTIHEGIDRAKKYLIAYGYAERSYHVPALVPMFGCRAH